MKKSAAAINAEEVIIPLITRLVPVSEAGSMTAITSELAGFTGYEGISNEAWIIPRIKIIQPTSKKGTARFTPPKTIPKEMEAEIAGIVVRLMDAEIKRTFEAEEAAMDSEGGSSSEP